MSCIAGTVELDFHYRPRPEYGLIVPLLSAIEGGVTARGGAEWLVLTTPVPMSLDGEGTRARLSMSAGETLHFGNATVNPR